MYTMILVDDEKIVLQGIQKVCAKENYGFEISGAFYDPLKALEELPVLRPQLIITDVKMPQMDGLEFAARAKEILPNAEIVILSGYRDFSYAQTAVKIGVSDYLLKPVKKSDFAEMLHHIHEKIENRTDQTVYFQALQEYAQNNRDELKNHFFLKMAENGESDEAYVHAFCSRINPDLEKADSILLKLVINDFPETEDYTSSIGKLMDEVRELMSAFGESEIFMSDDEIFVLIYGDRCGDSRDDITEITESLIASKRRQNVLTVYGISHPFQGIMRLYAARNECDSQILVAQSGSPDGPFENQNLDITIPYSDIEALFHAVSGNRTDQIRDSIDKIYDLPAHSLYRDYTFSLTFIILLRLSRRMIRYGVGSPNISAEILNIRNLKQEYPGLMQQKKLVLDTALKAAALTEGKEEDVPTKIVQSAVDYIQEHFCENISLTDISEHVNVSKSYLCDLFKKELNVTIINYVTNLRMEKAKELLISTDLKMYEISLSVGYNDYTYFSQIFKRSTGCTLSEYRRKYR